MWHSSLEGHQSRFPLTQNNLYLSNLDLSKNGLGDDFAFELAKCLTTNDTLFKVNISQNPINTKGAMALLKVLKESNDTLISLGDISM